MPREIGEDFDYPENDQYTSKTSENIFLIILRKERSLKRTHEEGAGHSLKQIQGSDLLERNSMDHVEILLETDGSGKISCRPARLPASHWLVLYVVFLVFDKAAFDVLPSS